jgi:putative oxidoreductase
MRIVTLVARILLGLIFGVLGLNGFLNFIPAPPMTGDVATYLNGINAAHYSWFIFGVQVLAGLLLLTGQYVPLAIFILAPVLANILVFHILIMPMGLPPALLALVLWVIVAWPYRSRFAPIFKRY